MLAIVLPQLSPDRQTVIRCEDCAGESAPADLPPLEKHEQTITPIPKARSIRGPLFDGKLAALGEDQ
jgi:hypothetical protein